MEIAQLKNCKSIEGCRDKWRNNVMSFEFNLRRIIVPTSVETSEFEARRNSKTGQGQVLNMKKVYSLPKNLRFMISFDAKP